MDYLALINNFKTKNHFLKELKIIALKKFFF